MAKQVETVVANEPNVNALIVTEELGRTTIEPDVVAKIAGLAVREVAGVHALVPYGAGQAISNLAAGLRGGENRDLGVKVEVGKIEAAVDVRIVVDYGASVPEVGGRIRESVRNRIGGMTGLTVREINITVVDLYFETDQAGLRVR